MVNLKKYIRIFEQFVIFLTLALLLSCSNRNYFITKIDSQKIGITTPETENKEIEKFIKPYRENIKKDLDEVLAYCPETLDKNNGQWQTPIGNLFADVSLQYGDKIFGIREKKKIDICILNHGGIRSILPKGNVTTRTAFEIMPFENSLVVIELKGEQVLEMAYYFIAAKKAQPLAGMTFTIDQNKKPKNIKIQGKDLDTNTIYYVATNEYLANGGDNMAFFKKGIQTFDLNYKLRNILIDYFKAVDTIPILTDIRITVE